MLRMLIKVIDGLQPFRDSAGLGSGIDPVNDGREGIVTRQASARQ